MKRPLLAFCLYVALPGLASVARAQIVPDATLGTESSMIELLESGQMQIQGGATRGANLFHSFTEFSILSGQAAYFNNPAGIANILSRVTGSNPSQIFGTLGVLGDANLFLLNPNGIIFGVGANLDLNGAFVASTAGSLVFSNGQTFSAVNPNGAPLLTVDIPVNVGLHFGSEVTGAIVNTGDLSSPQSLTLVGRSVVNVGQLAGTNVDLLGVSEAINTVQLAADGTIAQVIAGNTVDEIAVSPLLPTLPSDLAAIAEVAGSTAIGGTIAADATVRVLGDRVALVNADITAPNIQVGGSYRGENAVTTAARTVVDADSRLTSEQVVVWANDLTVMTGRIDAPGGFVEVSAKEQLIFRGEVDAATFLLDPRNIIISAALPTSAIATLPEIIFDESMPLGTDITVNVHDLVDKTGQIILEATNDIIIDTSVISLDFFSSNNKIKWAADADEDGVGSIHANFVPIYTNGRDIYLQGANLNQLNVTTTHSLANGDSGIIDLESTVGNISANTIDSSSALGFPPSSGDAARTSIRAANDIFVEGKLESSSSGSGDAGEIDVSAGGNIEIFGGVQAISPSGNGNNIKIVAEGDVFLNNWIASSGILSNGNIDLTSNDGSITIDTALLTSGDVNSDTLDFLAAQGIPLPPALVSSFKPTQNAGSITFSAAESINVNTSAVVAHGSDLGTAGGAISFQGVGGDLVDVNLSTAYIESDTFAGNAGDISFNSVDALNANRSIVSASSEISADGASPNLAVDAAGAVNLLNGSFFAIENRGEQATGNIAIHAASLTVQGSLLSASTDSVAASGAGGEILVNVQDDVVVSGSLPNTVLPTASAAIASLTLSPARAGNVEIHARNVTTTDSAAISVIGTDSGGAPGNIEINARESITVSNGSAISADTASNQAGGNITLNAPDLFLANNGSITASTFDTTTSNNNTGNGGNIAIVTERVVADSNSQIATRSTNNGNGGNLTLVTQDLALTNSSTLTVSSEPFSADTQTLVDRMNSLLEAGAASIDLPAEFAVTTGNGGGDAGTLSVTANTVALSNQSQIIGESSSGDGGNLNLNVHDLLLMRFNSSISATAGTAQAGGNGGNIAINAPFIVAIPTENSDITANAFTGSGGNITINAVAIIGLGFRPFLTPLSDITASSELGVQGTVVLNLSGTDLNPDLATLPSEPANVEIAEGCQAIGRGAAVDFTVVEGGVESSQSSGDTTTVRWIDLDLIRSASSAPTAATPLPTLATATASIHNCDN